MTEWIKCSEQSPKSKRPRNVLYNESEEYKILVKIGQSYFIGTAISGHFFYISEKDSVLFNLATGKWSVPTYFKEPEYWMELSEAPHD